MNDSSEHTIAEGASDQPALRSNWTRSVYISLAIMIVTSLPVSCEHSMTGSADRLADTPMIPLMGDLCFAALVALVLPWLVTAGAGALWVAAVPEIPWWPRILPILIHLAVCCAIIAFFEPAAMPSLLVAVWLFVWGGWIASRCHAADLAPMNKLACGGFRLAAWLYATGIGIAGMTSVWMNVEPRYEHGYALTGVAWFWASALIISVWLSVRVLPPTSRKRGRLARTLMVLFLAATVFMASDVAMLRSYLLGDFGNTIAAADPRNANPVAMQLVTVNGRTVLVDRGPVTKGQFICFLNHNPEWQRFGARGRRQTIDRCGDCGYSIYLRCLSPAFRYLPIRWMYAYGRDLDSQMTHVDSDVAAAYAAWVGKRLPSLAELKAAGGQPMTERDGGYSGVSGEIASDDPLSVADEHATFRCAKDVPGALSTSSSASP